MKSHEQIALNQEQLNVSVKTRSNIFNWRGQFTPEFVDYLLDCFAKATDTTFDPFCGSGTVLLESARRNLFSTGYEINPAAYAMARFITLANLTTSERRELCNAVKCRVESLLGSHHSLPMFEPESAFRERYRNLIHFAGDFLSQNDNKNEMVVALNCLFHAENHKPKALVSEAKRFSEAKLLNEVNTDKGDLASAIRRSFSIIMNRLVELPEATKKLTADLCDARLAHERLRDSINLIITSPPYINVFNYHQNYRAIMEVLGFDILKVAASEIGSNRKNRSNRFKTVVQYALDMEEALASFAHCLKTNGLLILIVGRESCVRGMPFSNSRILLQIADGLESYRQEMTHERVFINRFGKRIKEDILVLRKENRTPVLGNARGIAMSHLQKSFTDASGDVADDIAGALSEIDSISHSPLFSKKGII
jgi:DNA modification methylase